MVNFRIDVCLEQLDDHQDVLSGLKAGSKLSVIRQGDTLACATSEGDVVGVIPANTQSRLGQGELAAAVRTLKRKNEAVTLLEVRISSGPSVGQSAPSSHAVPTEGEEDTTRLTRDQLDLLARDKEVRCMLRDERLQGVIRDIDGSADRERALIQALQAPNFKEFTDKVLLRIAPHPS